MVNRETRYLSVDYGAKSYLLSNANSSNYHNFISFYSGAKRLFEKKPHVKTDYIGVQYYGKFSLTSSKMM